MQTERLVRRILKRDRIRYVWRQIRCHCRHWQTNCNRKLDYRCCLQTIFLHFVRPSDLSPFLSRSFAQFLSSSSISGRFRFVPLLAPRVRRDRQRGKLENKFVYNTQICLDNIVSGHDILWRNELLYKCVFVAVRIMKYEASELGNIFTFNVNAAQNGK